MKNRLSVNSYNILKICKIVVVAVSCMYVCQCNLNSRPIPDNLSQKIKNLYIQYPPPQDFKSSGDTPREIIKSDRGTYGGWYHSSMNSEDVINYYSRILTKDKWSFDKNVSYNITTYEKTNNITFSKDGFRIAIAFTEDENLQNEERVYGLNYGYRP